MRLSPRFAPAHNNLGLALLQLGRMELAVAKLLARAVALEPGNPAAQHLAGHALLQAKRPAEALPYLQEANRLAPHQAAIVTDLADALRRMGDLSGCLPWATGSGGAGTGPDRGVDESRDAARDTGALELSEEASRRALAIDPEHGEAHFNMALTLLLAGRMREAWPHWQHRWRGIAGARARFADRAWATVQPCLGHAVPA